MSQSIHIRLKRISNSDDCQAIGWMKRYTPIEKRETTPQITLWVVGFNEEAVEDVYSQCEDIMQGYVIWKPPVDDFKRIFQALVVKKTPSLEEFQQQYETKVQLYQGTSSIVIPAGSKILADNIQDALILLGEAKKSPVNRISESIIITQDIRRFIKQDIQSLAEEAKCQRVIIDLKKRNLIILHGSSDHVHRLKEKINCCIDGIRTKLITRSLQLTSIESDLMRSNKYEILVRIENQTTTIIRDVKADEDSSKSTTEDNDMSLPMMAVINNRDQSIVVMKADITQIKNVDAIVNAANGTLYHAGGIDRSISDSAGAALNEDCKKIIANNDGLPLAAGEAVKTTAGNLPFKCVIHAIGPQYIDGNQNERLLLFSCIMKSLQLAEKESYHSIALPAISSKTYGFPLTDCTNIIVRSVKQFFANYPQSNVRKVILTDMDDTACNSFAQEILVDHRYATNENNDDMHHISKVHLLPLRARWCWQDDCDIKLYTDSDMRRIDAAFENYLKYSQSVPTIIQPDNLRSGTIVTYYIHFLPNMKEYLLENSSALDSQLVCGYQRRENTGFKRKLIRYPLEKGQENRVETFQVRLEPLDSYKQHIVKSKEHWRINGLTDIAVNLAEEAIRTAIRQATITETFSIHLDKNTNRHQDELNSIAKQHSVELIFSGHQLGQLSMMLKGFKVNIAEAKSSMALYANTQLNKEVEKEDELRIPKEWEDQNEICELVEIPNNDPSFIRIEKRMKETLSNVKIHRIERVQNTRIWNHYTFRRRELQKELNHLPQLRIEMELFHGTTKTSPKEIYMGEYGFDMTFSTSGSWGIGTYFAENASYSCDRYAYKLSDGKRQVFLAQVLTGEVYDCASDPSLRRPPKKNESVSGLRYNSVSGKAQGSRVYIVYENRVAYPTYLITFTA